MSMGQRPGWRALKRASQYAIMRLLGMRLEYQENGGVFGVEVWLPRWMPTDAAAKLAERIASTGKDSGVALTVTVHRGDFTARNTVASPDSQLLDLLADTYAAIKAKGDPVAHAAALDDFWTNFEEGNAQATGDTP